MLKKSINVKVDIKHVLIFYFISFTENRLSHVMNYHYIQNYLNNTAL